MAISETVQMGHPQDGEHHHQDSHIADDIYEDANIMNKEGADKAEGGLGAMNDGGNNSFLFLSMCSHSLLELEDNVQANIEDGNLDLSFPKKDTTY